MADKFYWLKLKRDFFKRHDIKVIESMPNGKDYVLFYLKLLVESLDHDGTLRFSDTIPYNENMLSAVTNTNVDIVRSALTVFRQLNLIEIWDDNTLFMKEVEKLTGSETKWAEKKRDYRLKGQIEDNVLAMSSQCPEMSDKSIEIRDKSIENRDIIPPTEPKKREYSRFKKPTIEEIEAYCKERNNGVDATRFYDYYEARGWELRKGFKMKDWKACVRTWEKNATSSSSNFSKEY